MDGSIVILVTVVSSSSWSQPPALYLPGPVHRQTRFPLATDSTLHLVGLRTRYERAVHVCCGLSGNTVALLYPLEAALFFPTRHTTEVLRGDGTHKNGRHARNYVLSGITQVEVGIDVQTHICLFTVRVMVSNVE